MAEIGLPDDAAAVKSCCAALYESDWARLLLGDSFHPGGMALTDRLGTLLGLRKDWRILDVASGKGASAIYLAQRFGCHVVGVDYGLKSVKEANIEAERAGVANLVCFELGDAESLPFLDSEFDAVICECAFCSFPNKTTVAGELSRVLRSGGRLGMSDLTRSGSLPDELNNLLAWIACIADAQPVEEYESYLESMAFTIEQIENHDEALIEMVDKIRVKLIGAELLMKLKQLDLPGADFEQAGKMARHAAEAIQEGKLGYAILIAKKPATVAFLPDASPSNLSLPR